MNQLLAAARGYRFAGAPSPLPVRVAVLGTACVAPGRPAVVVGAAPPPGGGLFSPAQAARLYEAAGYRCNDWLLWDDAGRARAARAVLGPAANPATVAAMVAALTQHCWLRFVEANGGRLGVGATPYQPGTTLVTAPAGQVIAPSALPWGKILLGVAAGAGLVGLAWYATHHARRRRRLRAGRRRSAS